MRICSTTDVAPRAEVNEAYWEGVEYGHKDGAALVAREIFEEIEKNECHDISGKTTMYMLFAEELAELKKKYTEAEPEPPKGD